MFVYGRLLFETWYYLPMRQIYFHISDNELKIIVNEKEFFQIFWKDLEKIELKFGGFRFTGYKITFIMEDKPKWIFLWALTKSRKNNDLIISEVKKYAEMYNIDIKEVSSSEGYSKLKKKYDHIEFYKMVKNFCFKTYKEKKKQKL
jgi:hypothetical protein